MTITFQDGELRQLLRQHVQSTQPELLANEQDQTLTYPDWLGTGYKRDLDLPSGISLTLHRYRLHQDVINACSAEQSSCFEFMFSLTTQYQFNEEQIVCDRHTYLCGPYAEDCRWREFAGQQYLSVDIHLDPPLLAELIGTADVRLPSPLKDILDVTCQGEAPNLEGHRPFTDPVPITPAIQTALWQILQCPYKGVTQKLYLEAKSLELIALFLEVVAENCPSSPSLNRNDIECIHHAQHILQQNLQTPPTLVELAHQVGLNDRKLKEGFRQVFDTTVFGYLTQLRMEKARQLLAQQRSVAAVAAAVGYASPTAFSGAFRRKFGITPKAYQLGGYRGA